MFPIFHAIPPILAILTLNYLLKAMGLGNLFKPSSALGMASGGAGKIVGQEAAARGIHSKITGAPRSAANFTADKALRTKDWVTGSSRSRRATGAALRPIETGKKAKKALESRRERETTANNSGVTKSEMRRAALKQAAAKAALMAVGKDTKTGQELHALLKPHTYAKDNAVLHAQHRALETARKAELDANPGNKDKQDEINARFDLDALNLLGATSRGLGEGDAFSDLTAAEIDTIKGGWAAHNGGKKEQWEVGTLTGAVVPGSGPTTVPDLKDPEAIWEASKHFVNYLPAEVKELQLGESGSQWADRMMAYGQVLGYVDKQGNTLIDMHQELGVKDTAEFRQKMVDMATWGKPDPIQYEIAVQAEDKARVEQLTGLLSGGGLGASARQLNVVVAAELELKGDIAKEVEAATKNLQVTASLVPNIASLSPGALDTALRDLGDNFTKAMGSLGAVTIDVDDLVDVKGFEDQMRSMQSDLESKLHDISRIAVAGKTNPGRMSFSQREIESILGDLESSLKDFQRQAEKTLSERKDAAEVAARKATESLVMRSGSVSGRKAPRALYS